MFLQWEEIVVEGGTKKLNNDYHHGRCKLSCIYLVNAKDEQKDWYFLLHHLYVANGTIDAAK